MPSSQTVTENLDLIRQYTEAGAEYWRARQIMPVLGYADWENFRNAIGRAIDSFEAAEEHAENHFLETTDLVQIGSGAERHREDYFLSRAACYLIAMNGDPRKPEIAEAQSYFAVQTRNMEKLQRVLLDKKRVALRERVRDRNLTLSSTAKAAGVKQFGLFHGAGIRGLYSMSLSELRQRKGIVEKDWLDRAGIEELAANEFRITQADAKIKRENIQGEERAADAHHRVGKEVRGAISRMQNTMPEDLAPEPPIKEVKKRLTQHRRKKLPPPKA